MTLPTVYTPATLAQRWLCSERHVRKLIETGELNAFRVGARMFRIKMEDVERFECQNGDLPDSEANSASHGTTQTVSADVIDLAPQTRKKRPASPRLDLHN